MNYLRKAILAQPSSPEIQDAPVIPIPTELNETQRAIKTRQEHRAKLGDEAVRSHELCYGLQSATRQIGNHAVQDYAEYLQNRAEQPPRVKRLASLVTSLLS